MKRILTHLLSVFFFVVFFAVNTWPAEKSQASNTNKCFLWKVQSRTATVYLLGSIHYLKKNIYPLDRRIEDAFNRSGALVVEANIDDIGKVDLLGLMEKAFYTDGDTLDRHISGEAYTLVEKNLASYGIPVELVKNQRPWFAALTITSFGLLKSGLDPDYGIDKHFISEARGKKKILELESLEYQMELLSSFSDSEQEAFLLYTLQDLAIIDREADQLILAWTNGDAKAMESLMLKGSVGTRNASFIYEKLLYERNNKMSSRIEDYLKTRETYFVVVGAAHLIGNRGIVEILRKKGYAVEQK